MVLRRALGIALVTCLLGPAARAAPADKNEKSEPAAAPSGSQGLKPLAGISAFLDLDEPTPLGGNKFLFGLDWVLGAPTGLGLVFGLHLGSGDRVLLVAPVAELHYGFDLGSRVVPWVGGGLSLRVTAGSTRETNIGVTARLLAGADWYITSWGALSLQIAMPDVGLRVVPGVAATGTVEWMLGPHFRL